MWSLRTHAPLRLRAPALARSIKTLYTEHLGGTSARAAILAGATTLARAVATTLGPSGRSVLVCEDFKPHRLTRSGLEVAKAVEPGDPYAVMGWALLRDCAARSGGDGASTTVLVAHAVLQGCVQHVACGGDPQGIRKGVQQAAAIAKDHIAGQSQALDMAMLPQVASVAANGDRSVGALVAEAFGLVGLQGVVLVEKGSTTDSSVSRLLGFGWPQGYLEPFASPESPHASITLEKPLVVMFNSEVVRANDVLPAMAYAKRQDRPLLIVANKLHGDALAVCVANRARGQCDVLAVNLPGFGDHRWGSLEDLQLVVGGVVVLPEAGTPIPSAATAPMFGSVSSAVVGSDRVELTVPELLPTARARATELARQIEAHTTKDYHRQQLQERHARITSGAAVVKVGGSSAVEVEERRLVVAHAVDAARAALSGGIVPGGGVALLRAACAVEQALEQVALPDERCGHAVVARALRAPASTIIANSGVDAPYVVGKIMEHELAWFGYDVERRVYGDMRELHVVDPTSTLTSTLEAAAGVASLVSTAEVAVVNVTESKAEARAKRRAKNARG